MQKERSDEERHKKYLDICGGIPDAIAIFGGGVRKVVTTRGNVRYTPNAFRDRDAKGLISGAKLRVFAALELAAHFPDAAIVTMGHQTSGMPPSADIQTQELTRRKIPIDRIIPQRMTDRTFAELVRLVKLMVLYGWRIVLVITNGYHIPRAQEMYLLLGALVDRADTELRAALENVMQRGARVVFVSAEEIAEARSPHYKALIARIQKTPAYQERVAAEEKGMKHLREGTYKFSE